MEYLDIMVDIETTGLNHDHNAMIQLAAVKFNLEERTIDTSNMFCQSLLIPPGRYWEESTRAWWAKQNQAVFQSISANMRDPRTVMTEYVEWAGFASNMRFWAKPTTFDYCFVDSYIKQYGLSSPYHYRNAVDLNSFLRGLKKQVTIPETQAAPIDGAHHALNDAIYQIDVLFYAMDEKWVE